MSEEHQLHFAQAMEQQNLVELRRVVVLTASNDVEGLGSRLARIAMRRHHSHVDYASSVEQLDRRDDA